MKMCLKLAYFAFSSSPSKDATMNTFWRFSTLCVEVQKWTLGIRGGGVPSDSPNPDPRPYLRSIPISRYYPYPYSLLPIPIPISRKGVLPKGFSSSWWWWTLSIVNLVTIKYVKRRQPLNEDVFEATSSILCFLIVSFKRCYDECLLGFFLTLCWSLNILMSFFPSETWL